MKHQTFRESTGRLLAAEDRATELAATIKAAADELFEILEDSSRGRPTHVIRSEDGDAMAVSEARRGAVSGACEVRSAAERLAEELGRLYADREVRAFAATPVEVA